MADPTNVKTLSRHLGLAIDGRAGNPALVVRQDADPGTATASNNPDWRLVAEPVVITRHLDTTQATADINGTVLFIADRAYELLDVRAIIGTPSNAATSHTAMVTKAASGTAITSGTDMLSAGLDLTTTADTNITGSLHATAANLLLAAGDRIGLAESITGNDTAGLDFFIQLRLAPVALEAASS